MSEWDSLFLAAAGKSSSSSINKRSSAVLQQEHQPTTSSRVPAVTTSLPPKKVARKGYRGKAAKSLLSCGFYLAETADFVCGSSARHTMVDKLSDDVDLFPIQRTIRKMFVLTRNARAVGFMPFQRSHTPIRHAYRRKRKLVGRWLLELRGLAASCSELILTRTHISQGVTALQSLPTEEGESDAEGDDDVNGSDITVSSMKLRRQRQTVTWQGCQCSLRLIAALDAVYGELLVAGIEAGVSLPDPRLYLDSVVGDEMAPSSSSSSSSSSKSPTNPLLRYLELRDVEAITLNLAVLSKYAVAVEGLSPGPHEGTMRGSDPLSCDTVRCWWQSTRYRVCAWASFACPNDRAIQAMKAFSRSGVIVEVGAGVGYWAMMLRGAGCVVKAYDKRLADNNHNHSSGSGGRGGGLTNEYHGRFPSWSEVLLGDAHTVLTSSPPPFSAPLSSSSSSSSSNLHRTSMLFLCYPPPDDAMASRAFTAFAASGGTRFAYVGEFQGDTGTRAFETQLSSGWDLQETVALPQQGNTCYSLTLWQRKLPGPGLGPRSGLALGPLVCASCHRTAMDTNDGATTWVRDRLTRSVWVCSMSCSRTDKACAALREQCALRHIGYGPPAVDMTTSLSASSFPLQQRQQQPPNKKKKMETSEGGAGAWATNGTSDFWK